MYTPAKEAGPLWQQSEPDPHASGKGASHQVRWRSGGTRAGTQRYESFTTLTKAERFRIQVEEAGEQWPDGWVKGRGYLAEEPPPV